MRHSATAAMLAVALLALPGCTLFRGDANAYLLPADQRPLEVPPDLVVSSSGEAVADAPQSVLRSGTGTQRPAGMPPAPGNGFNVDAPRDQVFVRVGEALAAVDGLEIASSAQLLGAYDVSYGGGNFLVRVTASGTGTYVSAVDPRGLPAEGEGPSALMAQLKAALGGE